MRRLHDQSTALDNGRLGRLALCQLSYSRVAAPIIDDPAQANLGRLGPVWSHETVGLHGPVQDRLVDAAGVTDTRSRLSRTCRVPALRPRTKLIGVRDVRLGSSKWTRSTPTGSDWIKPRPRPGKAARRSQIPKPPPFATVWTASWSRKRPPYDTVIGRNAAGSGPRGRTHDRQGRSRPVTARHGERRDVEAVSR